MHCGIILLSLSVIIFETLVKLAIYCENFKPLVIDHCVISETFESSQKTKFF